MQIQAAVLIDFSANHYLYVYLALDFLAVEDNGLIIQPKPVSRSVPLKTCSLFVLP